MLRRGERIHDARGVDERMIAPGTQLSGYQVLAELRSGGMANLFLGARKGPGGFERYVVIKAVKGHLAGHENFIRMFLDEARIAARIEHPHVVRIEELGDHDGTYFLVMEHVLGVALSELLAALAESGQRMMTSMTVRIVSAVCAGLHAAHETTDAQGRFLGVVHRDVSPQNVLLGVRGEIKLIDFGIAKARDRLHVTAAGSGLKGKLRYMAPEQLLRADVDRRADVYSLGVMAWEMLTMRRLFQGKSDVEVMQRIRQGNHAPPGAFVQLPHAVDEAVMAALDLEPNRRPQTADAFRRMLRDAMPSAAAVDESEITALLHAVRGALIHQRAQTVAAALAAPPAGPAMMEEVDDHFADASTIPSSSMAPRFEASDVVYSAPEYVTADAADSVPISSLYEVLDDHDLSALRAMARSSNRPLSESASLPETELDDAPPTLAEPMPARWQPLSSPSAQADERNVEASYREGSEPSNLPLLIGVALLGLLVGALLVLGVLVFVD
ncbi:MAG: serine/threonine-protein kinase [Myxococcota bacterium]